MNQFRLIVLLEVMAYTMLPNHAALIQVCGDELREAVMTVCGSRGYYSPRQGFSHNPSTTQRGIATQCCDSACESSILEKYCNPPATPQSETAAAPPRMTPSEEDRRTNEIVIDYPDQTGNNGSKNPRVDGESEQETRTTNKSKQSSTEIDEESYTNEGDTGVGKLDDRNPSERGESLVDEEDTDTRDKPTNRPHHKEHSKERGKNRTSKASERRLNNSRRRGSGKKDAKQRRRERQRLLRRQSNYKRRSKTEKKAASGENTVTTPVAVETADHPFKNGGYNSTSGDLSPVNITDTASASERKDDFFTTIRAVLRGVGFQHTDDGNR